METAAFSQLEWAVALTVNSGDAFGRAWVQDSAVLPVAMKISFDFVVENAKAFICSNLAVSSNVP